jgi:hypothetical protein
LFITENKVIIAVTENNYGKLDNFLFVEDIDVVYFEDQIEKYFGDLDDVILDNYAGKESIFLQQKLFKDMGMNEDEIDIAIEESNNFENGKGYILTADNYRKILIIDKKMKLGHPLILMGETGCGKTYLLEYYAKVIRKNEVIFTKQVMHAGVTEDQLVQLLDSNIENAEKNPDKEIWIFFDEINTSIYQKLISDLMIDRIYSFGIEKCKNYIKIIIRS